MRHGCQGCQIVTGDLRKWLRLVEAAGSFTPEQAREIGSCAIIAMAHITGLSWDQVWEQAKPYYTRFGMDAGAIGATMRELGWKYGDKSNWKLLGMPVGLASAKAMTVQQAQVYLQEHEPDARLICLIHARGVPHSIAFADGQFHNVEGAWRARIRLAYYCTQD